MASVAGVTKSKTGRAIRGLGLRPQSTGWGLFRQGIGLVALYWLLRTPRAVETAIGAIGRGMGWLSDPAATIN